MIAPDFFCLANVKTRVARCKMFFGKCAFLGEILFWQFSPAIKIVDEVLTQDKGGDMDVVILSPGSFRIKTIDKSVLLFYEIAKGRG